MPSGSKVSLTLRPLRQEGYSRAILTARFEGLNNHTRQLQMSWSGLDGARDLFSGVLDTGEYVGLIWYSFDLERLDGRRCERLGPYQLTVYDGSEQVPTWFGQGMTYQIFPDRFRRTKVPDPRGMVGGRWVHVAWQEEPEYRPDRHGEIRNRDFFGGDLKGVMEKLDYLQGLGVETLYFCPIFEAAENHRYGTADYSRIDPMLGTNEDFTQLCKEVHRRGMRIMLDGVFNHTGYVSRYFNGDGFYPDLGAIRARTPPIAPGSTSPTGPTSTKAGGASTPCPPSMSTTPPTGNSSSAERTAWCAGGCGRGRTAGGWMWPTSCPTTSSTASTRPPAKKIPTPSSSARCGRTAPPRWPTECAASTFWGATATA